jgi:hypothetical protein
VEDKTIKKTATKFYEMVQALLVAKPEYREEQEAIKERKRLEEEVNKTRTVLLRFFSFK